jgi:hypothetical protein
MVKFGSKDSSFQIENYNLANEPFNKIIRIKYIFKTCIYVDR